MEFSSYVIPAGLTSRVPLSLSIAPGPKLCYKRSKGRGDRLELNGSLSFRAFRELFFWVPGGYAATHDQLSLPKSGATLDQILPVRKDQATTYSYGINVGLSFTFGSIYSNVVNPRSE